MLNEHYTKRHFRAVIPFLTALFIPLYPMLYLYSQARNAQYLSLFQVLAVSLIFMIGSAILFFIANKIIKSPYGALLFCVTAWIVFFAYGKAYLVLDDKVRMRHRYFLPICAIVLIALCLLFRHLSKKYRFKTVSFYVSVLFCILLVVNAGMAGYQYFSLKSYGDAVYKTTFTVDSDLPSPNVYWFHCDGMLGFEAMERYLNDSQHEFTVALESRGFVINREAQFEAYHSTQVAIPALMNPYFYDNQMAPRMAGNMRLNYEELTVARQNKELVIAFEEKSYQTATLGDISIYTFPNTDVFYDCSLSDSVKLTIPPGNEALIKSIDSAVGLWSLLRTISPLGAFDKDPDGVYRFMYSFLYLSDTVSSTPFTSQVDVDSVLESDTSKPYYEALARGLDDVLDMPEPRFVLAMYNMAHRPFIYDENGEPHSYDAEYIHSYPPHHRYTAKVLLNIVDMILEQDPSAVIVLQADHGLHGQSAKEIMTGLDVSEESVNDIWNGVMSAVRVPEQYGVIEDPIHPLDITRYLVNHYVGENYEYITR